MCGAAYGVVLSPRGYGSDRSFRPFVFAWDVSFYATYLPFGISASAAGWRDGRTAADIPRDNVSHGVRLATDLPGIVLFVSNYG